MLPRLLALLCLLLPFHSHAVSIEQLTKPGGVVHAAISPDGKHIAAIGFNGVGHYLMLVNADTLGSEVLLSGQVQYRGWDRYVKSPRSVFWAANDLMVVNYGFEAETVNLEGRMVRQLGGRMLGPLDALHPDGLLLGYPFGEDDNLAVVDARSGAQRRLQAPRPGKPLRWLVDRQGQLRAMTMANGERWADVSRISHWYRDDEHSAWRQLAEFSLADERWTPLFFDEQPHTLAVLSREGRDTYAVFAYDTEKRQLGEMMAGASGVDIIPVAGDDEAMLRGVQTGGMSIQRIWFDPAWATAQATIDAALPAKTNAISGNPTQRLIVQSTSDTDPGSWYVLDMRDRSLRRFAVRREALEGAAMRPMRSVSYPAKDGLTIPAFLTTPADAARPGPAVIMLNSTPAIRDHAEWNPDVQLLAAQGYTVLQPQFRGSTGFGKQLEQAGYGQWGLAMQDDVSAGVAYLVRQGLADPGRICTYGMDYGAYAALWGLIKTPQLFRCGVSFAGVFDLDQMFNQRAGDKATHQFMNVWIADARLRQADFTQVSPLRRSADIKAPVLLMHGAEDAWVPIAQSEQMARELERNKVTHQYIRFEEGGHVLLYTHDQIKYYRTLLDFLDRHIGYGAGQK